MIKTGMLVLCSIFCINLNKITIFQEYKINLIISEDPFLNSFGPKLFDFTKYFDSKDVMIHLKNIILKTTSDDLINATKKEILFNKQSLIDKLNIVKKIASKFSENLPPFYDVKKMFKKYDIILFKFFFKTLEIIVNCNQDNCTKKVIYNLMILNLNTLINKFNNKKRSQINSAGLLNNKNRKKVEFIKEIITYAKNTKYELQTKLFKNQTLSILCIKYFKNNVVQKKKYKQKQNTNNNITSTENTDTIFLDLSVILTNSFNPFFDFTSKNVSGRINNKINEIYNILEQAFNNDSFKLKLKHFAIIFVYYNFLTNQIYLKIEEIYHCGNHKLNKLYTIFKHLDKEITLIYDIFKKYFQIIESKKLYSEVKKNRHLIQHFIDINNIYNQFFFMSISKDINVDKYFKKTKEFISFINESSINNHTFELFDNEIFYLQTGCILILRVYCIYSLLENNQKMAIAYIVENIMKAYISKITEILTNVESNLDDNNKNRYLQEITYKIKQKIVSIYSYSSINSMQDKFKVLNELIEEECLLEIDMYILFCKMVEIYKSTLSKTFFYNKNEKLSENSPISLDTTENLSLLQNLIPEPNSKNSNNIKELSTNNVLSNNSTTNNFIESYIIYSTKSNDLKDYFYTTQNSIKKYNSYTNNLHVYDSTEDKNKSLQKSDTLKSFILENKNCEHQNKMDESKDIEDQDLKLYPLFLNTTYNDKNNLDNLIDTYLR
ncbi:hypothetical protein NUSPORA_01074 [Nucleospora cyclopteri]